MLGNCYYFNQAVPPLSSLMPKFLPLNSPNDYLCSMEEVYYLLSRLDTSKANGPDGISVQTFKVTAASIAPSVTALFNLFLQTAQEKQPVITDQNGSSFYLALRTESGVNGSRSLTDTIWAHVSLRFYNNNYNYL